MKKSSELLLKDVLRPAMRARLEMLNDVVAKITKRLNCVPKGVLNISSRQGKYQYYHVLSPSKRKGSFIQKKNMSVAEALAQRDYDKKALLELIAQQKILKKCYEKYNPGIVENMYSQLHLARRDLVAPLIYSDEDYVKRWNEVEYEGKFFEVDFPVLKTARGERVRSKSEVIIADALYHHGIPYRYEYPHRFLGEELNFSKRRRFVDVYPDFTCLKVQTREEVVWEHFGMVDDFDYCQNMISKMELYFANGFYLNKNFLMTFETRSKPLNSEIVNEMLKFFDVM